MAGAILVGLIIITIISFILSHYNYHNEEEWKFSGIILSIFVIVYIVIIPCSRIETKKNVEYIQVFQQTLDSNRENDNDLNVFERTAIINEINNCNLKIISWKVTGQKWYNNKWFIDKSTQNIEFLK
jgi:hypothetical protein